MGIERDLVELLHDHDCVIVPHWGGFLTHYRPARLDESRHMIHPPAKELGFNRHLVRNDGLLADHVAKRERIDFGQATLWIEQEVGQWTARLEREGRLELPHMGIFFRDAEGNLQFDPDKRTNFLRDAFGLRPLKALPVKEEFVPRAVPIIPLPAAPVEDEPVGQGYSMRWAAAAIALVLSGAAVYWVLQQGGPGNTRWSDVSPFRAAPEPHYRLPSSDLPGPVLGASVFNLPSAEEVVTVPIAAGDTVTLTVDLRPVTERSVARVDSTAVATPSVDRSVRARYHIIGGCFAQPENADKRLLELQHAGYPAVRLAQRGDLFPVAFGSYATRAEAEVALASIRQRAETSAWLLVR